MISISTHVQDWLNTNPFIQEHVASGIINHSALAREIRSDIEAKLGEKVSIESVTIALNRSGKAARKSKIVDPLRFVGDVSVQTGLEILIYEISDYDKLSFPDTKTLQQGYFVSTRGIWHASIITTTELAQTSQFKKTSAVHDTNITSTTIRLKPGHIPVPGVCAGILSTLANKGVNLQEVISTHNELTILTDQKNAELALKTLMDTKKINLG